MLWRTRLHLVRRSRGCALVMDVPFPTGGSSATGQHSEHCLMHPSRPPRIVYYARRDCEYVASAYGAFQRNGACKFAEINVHTRPLRALTVAVGRPMISPGDV